MTKLGNTRKGRRNRGTKYFCSLYVPYHTHIHWVTRVGIIVSLVWGLVVTPEERGLVRNQRNSVYVNVRRVGVGRVGRVGVCMLCVCDIDQRECGVVPGGSRCE